MNLLLSAPIDCPYCGETIDITIDTTIPLQDYIEDCAVCCRPISLQLHCTPGELQSLSALREDEV
ncbi:MAG: CPXCG motif-containing cysteine-rich protein [Candidatus Thiodiazotropha sp.]|jgi:hypothetical protein